MIKKYEQRVVTSCREPDKISYEDYRQGELARRELKNMNKIMMQ